MKQDIIVDTNIIFNAINAIKEYKNNYDTNTIKLENVQSYLSTMCRIDYLNLINIFEEIFTAAQGLDFKTLNNQENYGKQHIAYKKLLMSEKMNEFDKLQVLELMKNNYSKFVSRLTSKKFKKSLKKLAGWESEVQKNLVEDLKKIKIANEKTFADDTLLFENHINQLCSIKLIKDYNAIVTKEVDKECFSHVIDSLELKQVVAIRGVKPKTVFSEKEMFEIIKYCTLLDVDKNFQTEISKVAREVQNLANLSKEPNLNNEYIDSTIITTADFTGKYMASINLQDFRSKGYDITTGYKEFLEHIADKDSELTDEDINEFRNQINVIRVEDAKGEKIQEVLNQYQIEYLAKNPEMAASVQQLSASGLISVRELMLSDLHLPSKKPLVGIEIIKNEERLDQSKQQSINRIYEKTEYAKYVGDSKSR